MRIVRKKQAQEKMKEVIKVKEISERGNKYTRDRITKAGVGSLEKE